MARGRSRVTVRVKSDDQKWLSLTKLLKHMSGSYTLAGFPQQAKVGNPTKKGSGHLPASSMADVARIAAYQEYGTKTIPARPFMGPGFDENKEPLFNLQKAVVSKIMEGRFSVEQGIGVLGEFVASNIRKAIRKVTAPPLHPLTIARKKSDKPLIDTGQMIQSVSHVDYIGGKVKI